jgi:diguanylate cyclase (GGDEF)-like protein/PAS domain S-box-containing protein
MWSELRAVRQRYLGIVAIGFAAVPVVGYGVALWLGNWHDTSLFLSGAGRLLATFAVGWWLVALAHYRQIFTLLLPGEGDVIVQPKLLSRGLSRLHSHYWRWLCAYVVIASLIYAAEPATSATAAVDWLRCLLIQLVVAVLVGVPFYLLALNALGGFAAAAGLEKAHVFVESKLVLSGVLVPLLAGMAMMYFYWLRTGLWTEETLLVWSGLGVLVLSSVMIGSRSILRALQPLQPVITNQDTASYLQKLAALRPTSTDDLGLLIQSLSRLGHSLEAKDPEIQALIDAAPGGILLTDESGHIQMFNAVADGLLGSRLTELQGLPICDLLPGLRCEGDLPLPTREAQQLWVQNPDGRNLALTARIAAMERGGGHARFVCFLSENESDERMRRHAQETESRYEDLVESSRDLIWSMNEEGHWTFVNRAAKHIYGVEPAELIGCTVHEFTEPDYLKREKAAYQALWEGKDWLDFESVHHDRDGALHHLHFSAVTRKDQQGRVAAINGVTRDITEQKVYEQKLAYQASHDALTGLFNRNYLHQELERMVARVARGNEYGVLMFVDLDQLKFINDTIGHGAGDRLLVEAGRLLKNHTRESDLLARYGGDEFTVLLYNVDAEGARKVAENMRARFGEFKFLEGGNAYSLTCSIGLALIDEGVKSADECLAQAERACKNAKTLGRNQVVFYDAGVTKRPALQDATWLDRIKGLIEKEHYQLVYQPIASVTTGSIYDYEVLVRMVESEGHLLNPGAFLPTAERLGLSQSLDRSVVLKSIQELALLREAGQSVRFFINLTPAAMRDDTLLTRIRDTLVETKLDASVLTFEINETAAVADLVAAADFIRVIKEMGGRVVLEHFGLGFSSFTYLKHLPVDALKIDGSYIQGLTQSVVNQVVVRSINQVAHALGKVTIAPHVENKETLMLLRDLGVDYVQGYYLGRPERAIGAERYIATDIH